MPKEKEAESQDEESAAFNRRFKYAVIAYALIEFIVIVFIVYYKAKR